MIQRIWAGGDNTAGQKQEMLLFVLPVFVPGVFDISQPTEISHGLWLNPSYWTPPTAHLSFNGLHAEITTN